MFWFRGIVCSAWMKVLVIVDIENKTLECSMLVSCPTPHLPHLPNMMRGDAAHAALSKFPREMKGARVDLSERQISRNDWMASAWLGFVAALLWLC